MGKVSTVRVMPLPLLTCQSYATIQFGHYQQFAAIQCATSILLAIGKPLFAKLTDAAGRAEVC
jgi:hypothetical protein